MYIQDKWQIMIHGRKNILHCIYSLNDLYSYQINNLRFITLLRGFVMNIFQSFHLFFWVDMYNTALELILSVLSFQFLVKCLKFVIGDNYFKMAFIWF